jgi:hypothetical protein
MVVGQPVLLKGPIVSSWAYDLKSVLYLSRHALGIALLVQAGMIA